MTECCSVERQLMITGIGGQGVQFAGRLVAEAALAEHREVQLFGSYGGMMRGGDTASTVIVADGPIVSPPTVGCTWSAIVMHHEHWEGTRDRLAAGGVVLLNSTVFAGEIDREEHLVIDIPATELAGDLGNVMLASTILTGAYAAATDLVGLDALVEALPRVLPPYRLQHVAVNERALRVGFDAAPPGCALAWSPAGASS
jgi:Pyruvate/2-oxoacid:ferredoxin oxidoreductase gamma subunit